MRLEDIIVEVEEKIVIEELKCSRGNRSKIISNSGVTEHTMGLRVANMKSIRQNLQDGTIHTTDENTFNHHTIM